MERQMDGKTRRKLDERLAKPSPMVLTERDKAVVRAVADYHVLSQEQIQQLFFGGSSKTASQRRLVRLFDHRYLKRYMLPVRRARVGGVLIGSQILYSVDEAGIELLMDEFGYEKGSWSPTDLDLSDNFLKHTMGLAAFGVALTVACRRTGCEVLVWKNEAAMKADYDKVYLKGQAVALIPDGYFMLKVPAGKIRCFLELDRGTMQISRFRTKVEAYNAYRTTQQYEKRYGTKGFRVLTVVPGRQRLKNLKAMTEKMGTKFEFWFAVASELTGHTILDAPVWEVAGHSGNFVLQEPVNR